MNECCQRELLSLADDLEYNARTRTNGHTVAEYIRFLAGPIVPIHMCPIGDSGWMPCCGRVPGEVLGHRMTLEPDLVTCKGAKSGN